MQASKNHSFLRRSPLAYVVVPLAFVLVSTALVFIVGRTVLAPYQALLGWFFSTTEVAQPRDLLDNAVVKLVEVVCEHGKEERRPIGHTFTDKEGEFVFGPLCPGKEYALQIWVNDTKKIKICAKCHHEGKCLKGDKCDKCDCFINEKHEPCKKCDKKDDFLKEEDFKDMNF